MQKLVANILQEVLAASWTRARHVSLIVADGAEELESRFEVISNLANGGQVTTSVAVVWGTPDSHDVLVGEVILISFVDQLVGARDEGKIVNMAKFIGNSISKQPACEQNM